MNLVIEDKEGNLVNAEVVVEMGTDIADLEDVCVPAILAHVRMETPAGSGSISDRLVLVMVPTEPTEQALVYERTFAGAAFLGRTRNSFGMGEY